MNQQNNYHVQFRFWFYTIRIDLSPFESSGPQLLPFPFPVRIHSLVSWLGLCMPLLWPLSWSSHIPPTDHWELSPSHAPFSWLTLESSPPLLHLFASQFLRPTVHNTLFFGKKENIQNLTTQNMFLKPNLHCMIDSFFNTKCITKKITTGIYALWTCLVIWLWSWQCGARIKGFIRDHIPTVQPRSQWTFLILQFISNIQIHVLHVYYQSIYLFQLI